MKIKKIGRKKCFICGKPVKTVYELRASDKDKVRVCDMCLSDQFNKIFKKNGK